MAAKAVQIGARATGASPLTLAAVNEDAPEFSSEVEEGPEKHPELKVNRVRPAYEQVAEQLRDRMLSAELLPGERLPSEAELAGMFGVGRTTIREGLRLLTSQQLVTTTRGVKGGTFVVTPDADNISRYLETSIGLLAGTSRLSIDELLEARMCLELPATRRATGQADKAQIAAIGLTVGSDQSVHMEHSNFHVAILQASGNRMLEVMARPIFDVLRTRLNRGAAPADFWDTVRDDHQQIFQAIGARDEAGAVVRMEGHLGHLASVYSAIDVAARDALEGGTGPAAAK